ncbi:hypothetical protein LLS1_32130 [Leifsonia sp. LS1]|uniref:DUF5979 domain-containing protein n=1 Tax=Leifsonia sp. LS1 TaxID=2828483 RepID=UPI001CFC97F0|nr:DUF5979 domain-containing protein [Leifsonia sp. LS1]GIT81544.1 hypothetical protein LLS1_32130 [Leifsonia sp. LS1]
MPVYRTVLAALGVAALTLVPVLAADEARAADLDVVTSLTISSPDPADPTVPLTVGQMFRVDVAWSLPAAAAPGDTFSVSFPSPVHGYASSFTLTDAAGAEVGTCTVDSDSFHCTLGDYAATHTGITGTLFFYASAVQTSGGTLLFQSSNGTVYHVTVPGGGIGEGTGSPATQPPTTLAKGGWQNADGTLGWLIYLPGSQLLHDGAEVTVTDTYDARLSLVPGSLSVLRVADADWNGGDWSGSAVPLAEGTGAGAYTVGSTPPSFTLTVHAPDPQSTYVVLYQLSVPAGTADGTVFANTVRGDGVGSDEASVAYVSAGGAASGETTRELAVTKRVAGDGVAPTGGFPITVACTLGGAPVAGYPASASIAADETHVFPRVPVGAQCAVSETDSRGATSIAYSPAASITVPEGDDPIGVTVTNTYAATPVVPGSGTGTPPPSGAPSATPTPAPGPADAGATSLPTTGALAHTGSTASPVLAAAAALALLAGLSLLGARRLRIGRERQGERPGQAG